MDRSIESNKSIEMKTAVYGAVLLGASVYVICILVPMASFSREVFITNQFSAPIELQFKTGDGKRAKISRLSPGEHTKFIYYIGDHDGRSAVSVSVAAKNLSDGSAITRHLELPMANQPPGMRVSDEWFALKTE